MTSVSSMVVTAQFLVTMSNKKILISNIIFPGICFYGWVVTHIEGVSFNTKWIIYCHIKNVLKFFFNGTF